MDDIEGLVVGEVHPPDPRNDLMGVMECDTCEESYPCHLEAFHSGSNHHRSCGGRWIWSPGPG
jgi:hypothetical protein